MSIARLMATNKYGVEIRQVTRKKQCWPGYDLPLKKCGLWAGAHSSHRHVTSREAQEMGFDLSGNSDLA